MKHNLPTFLKDSPLTQGLTNRKKKEFWNSFKRRYVKKGEQLFRMNEKPKSLYVVVSGEFQIITKLPSGEKKIVARAIAGDILGEVALLTGEPHSGGVVARIDSEVLYVGKKKLQELMAKIPQIAINIGHIEANRLRNQILGIKKVFTENRYIAHFTSFDSLEAHYVGLNIASAISLAAQEPVAYLHLSHLPQTPCQTLNMEEKSSQEKFDKILSMLTRYVKMDIKDQMLSCDEKLFLLPCPSEKLPIHALKQKDFPRLLGSLAQNFSHIFMEFGAEGITKAKTISILKQADLILMRVRRHEKKLESFQKTITVLEEKIPDFRKKVFFYVNDIEFPTADKAVPSSQKRKFQIAGPFVSIGLLKKKGGREQKIRKKITNTLLENQLRFRPQFMIRGQLSGLSDYLQDRFLTKNEVFTEARSSFRSLGRWLTNRSRGLALGGGGARALSEIGFLREMENAGIHFDFISGTSMGAVIGALWAMGYNSYEIENLFHELLPEDRAFFDYALPITAFFKGRKVNKILKRLFGLMKIEDLPIPFVCVAADVLSGELVYFDRGLLWRAVRASLSLPVIFPPVRYRNYYLIDGGALDNLPGAILKERKVQHVVGVNCTPLKDDSIAEFLIRSQSVRRLRWNKHFWKTLTDYLSMLTYIIRRPPILQIAYQAMMMEGIEVIRAKKHYFDFILNMDIAEYGLFDFHLREEIIASGQRTTVEYLPEIYKALKIKLPAKLEKKL
ncbi:MAG: hypothetical protein D6767_08050 [Candidatus Hydrogenedentota bacterium]|nr:MAG: hypothetical protein D6767_08050 [Candidatus Hydrogenedentota bacterium]